MNSHIYAILLFVCCIFLFVFLQKSSSYFSAHNYITNLYSDPPGSNKKNLSKLHSHHSINNITLNNYSHVNPSGSNRKSPLRKGIISEQALLDCYSFALYTLQHQVNPDHWQLLTEESPACTVWQRTSSGDDLEFLAVGGFDDVSVVAYNATVNNFELRKNWDDHVVSIDLLDQYAVDDEKTSEQDHNFSSGARGNKFSKHKKSILNKVTQHWNRLWKKQNEPKKDSNEYFDETQATNKALHNDIKLPELKPIEEVIHWRFTLGVPFVADRDIVYAQRFLNFANGVATLQVSPENNKELREPSTGCVRIRIYRHTTILFADNPDNDINAKGLRYVALYLDDPDSSLPKRLRNFVAGRTVPSSIQKLHEAAKKVSDP